MLRLHLESVECLKTKSAYLKLVQQLVVEYFQFSPHRLPQLFLHLLLWISIEFNTFTRQFNSCELARSQRQVQCNLMALPLETKNCLLPVISNTFFPVEFLGELNTWRRAEWKSKDHYIYSWVQSTEPSCLIESNVYRGIWRQVQDHFKREQEWAINSEVVLEKIYRKNKGREFYLPPKK